MNKTILAFFSIALLVFAFGSCKPKQSEYKSVYEAAKERDMGAQGGANESYEAASSSRPTTPSTSSSSESVRREKITPVSSSDASGLKAYSVVIASMGMKPNAESLKSRMEEAGYKTILVQNEQGMYRVIVASYDSKDQAVARRSEILNNFFAQADQESLRAKYGIPFNDWWILQREY